MNNNQSIAEIQNEIVNEFNFFDEWDEKYGYIIELGKKLPEMEAEHRKPENIIKGCQSQVWLTSEYKDGIIHYKADSDAIIVKGLVSLLIRVFDKHTPDEVLNSDIFFLDKIGMMQHLSPTRSNGLASMAKQIKLIALAYKAKV
jgi:cysteine desulfuration protein SufE